MEIENTQAATPDVESVSAAEFAAFIPDGTPLAIPAAKEAATPNPALDDDPSLLGAAFRQWNTVASTLSSHTLQERLFPADNTPVDTEQLIALLDQDEMWGDADLFLEVHTRGQYEATRRQVEMEKADRRLIEDTNVMLGMGAGLIAGVLDVPSLLPFGTAARAVTAGRGALAVGGRTAIASGLAATVTEGALQTTQTMRTVEESLASIGGATILGGVLGTGAAAVLDGSASRLVGQAKDAVDSWLRAPNLNERIAQEAQERWQALSDQIGGRIEAGKKPTKKQLAAEKKAFDALTAANDRLELYDDLSMSKAGPLEWARTIGPRVIGTFSSRWLDPIDTIFNRSQTVVGKKAVEQMIEVPVLLNKNLRGEATAIATTTEIDPFVGGWATFRDKMLGGSIVQEAKRKASLGDSFYAQARQAGFDGNFKAFDAAVDTAVRNGFSDPNGNPAVTAASKSLKELILDPVQKAAKEAGIELPESPFGALGYAPRKYYATKVMGEDGKGTAFKNEAAKYQYDILLAEAKAVLKENETLSPQKIAGIKKSAKTFAREAFKSIIGGKVDEEGAFNGAYLAGSSPFKARVVPIPDSVLAASGWIEQSVTALMDVYLRQTVPTIQMAKRFKTPTGNPDPGLEASVIPALKKEYEQLAEATKTSAERDAINAEGERVVAMVRNLRDAILHTDRFNPQTRWHSALNNAIQVTKLYQVTRLMGNIGLASLPDLANMISRQGPGRFAANIGQSFLKAAQLEGLRGKEVAEQAKRLGAAVEWATNASVVANADLMSPLNGVSSPVSRFVHKSARVFSISNFSVWWNDTTKSMSYRASVDRVLEAGERGWDSLPQYERTFLAHLGLDKQSVNRIGAAWKSQADDMHDGFLRWASITDWKDEEASRIFTAAINKDVSSTIIRPRTGDKALGFGGPLASLVYQFQSFLMSHALRTLTLAEQRVLANGTFSADALRVYTGFGSAIALGWFAEFLYALSRDAADPDGRGRHVQALADNPGQHLARAVDRSAVTGLFGNGNLMWERVGGVGMTRAFQESFEDKSQVIEARGRWLDRDPLQALMGPTLSQAADLMKFGVHVNRAIVDGKDFAKKDARTLREASPFQNHILVRGIFNEAQRHIAQDVLGVAYDRP